MLHLNDLVIAMVAAVLVELMKVPFRYFQRREYTETKTNIEKILDESSVE
jgi:hypothetical protein